RRAVFDDHLEITRYRELSASYPFAYGFILNTSSDDDDGIDCYILTNKIIKVGMILDCVPIGLLEQLENDEVDSKVICLLTDDDFNFDQVHIQQIKDFILQIFKKFPEVKIQFGEFKDKSFAINYINERSIS
ncbi:MAG TPA: inorganic diphosphatase, partial [Anaerolineales bacterium]|nr:inorganic diphosphatase [Anaerolineales bacterium]